MRVLKRRAFLKGSTAGLGMLVVPAYLVRAGKALADPGGNVAQGSAAAALDDTYFAQHFGVDEALIRRVLEAAMARGGDFADLFFQHSTSNYVGLEDGEVNRAYSSVDLGVGVRVLVGDQTGFAFTEDLSPASIMKAAATAATIAKGAAGNIPDAFKIAGHQNYYPIDVGWETVGIDQKIPFLESLNARVFDLDERVDKASIHFNDSTSRMLVVNTDGAAVEDYKPQSRLSAQVTAEQNGKRESNGYNLAGRRDIQSFTPEALETLASTAVERTVRLFDAVQPPAGEMPVVLAAGESGVLLHEAIGHGMEADFNRKDISIYSEMIGELVSHPTVTIVDNGTNPNLRGSINVDDEGNPSERTLLVENGILKGYLHDRISARHYGVEATGSGRRQSFRHKPMPRMRNTYMESGPENPEDIIKSVKRGVYAMNFSNGQVKIGAGDFSFYVSAGYLIEDGKLTAPVKDINMIGNGPEALRHVSMVGNDLAFAEGGWTCGKNGQSVAVGQGQPTIKIDSSVTIGGTAG